ncbi:lysophospholipid acyltransferase family protein [Bhargavaea cecembensis]|uniref:lysophospholipid acyltransferase family protein n=1 Tax=Bhargavaea cecembensis TaxID=394098 RepID=UPI00058FB76A|nr:lysophospholipid acyltransferase family protein [Bhargavaea cecembensis]
MKAVRSARTFGYLFGYLPFSIPALRKVKKVKSGHAPGRTDDLVSREAKKWASGILRRADSSVTVRIHGDLPEGPVLFASNHEGNFDIPVLIANLPKPFGFMSKAEVKKLPVIRKWMVEMNCVFIDRADRRSAVQSIRDMSAMLREGHSMLIFPEGTRSRGTGLGEFKAGFVRVAKDAGAPIVPVAISGTSSIMERNGNFICPAVVTVDVLEPIGPDLIEEMPAKEVALLAQERIARTLAGRHNENTAVS